MCQPQTVLLIASFWLDAVWGWHAWIFFCISTTRKVRDPDPLRATAPGRPDEFSIEKHRKKCESFRSLPQEVRKQSDEVLLGKNRPCAVAVQKLFSTPVPPPRGTANSERKIPKTAQNATSEVKERQYNVYLALVRAYSYRNVAIEETVNIKLQKVTQTDCAGSWWFGFQFEFE